MLSPLPKQLLVSGDALPSSLQGSVERFKVGTHRTELVGRVPLRGEGDAEADTRAL